MVRRLAHAALLAWLVPLAAGAQAPSDEAPPPEPKPAETKAPEPPAEEPAEPVPSPAPKKKRAPAPPAEEPTLPPRAGTPPPGSLMAPPSLGPEQDASLALAAARRFFADLILGDARELVSADCGIPFFVEDRKYATSDELLQEWLRNLREKRTDLLTLYGIELLTPNEMEKKYGKPPARLTNLPWRQPHTFLAVANLSGHAGVAVVQLGPRGWRVVGYHD